MVLCNNNRALCLADLVVEVCTLEKTFAEELFHRGRKPCQQIANPGHSAPTAPRLGTAPSMQLFVRCGGAVGTVSVDTQAEETFEVILERVQSGRTAGCSGQVVGVKSVVLSDSALAANSVSRASLHRPSKHKAAAGQAGLEWMRQGLQTVTLLLFT